MAVKFLDLTGLQKFWNKCKAAFVAKDSSGNVTVNGVAEFNARFSEGKKGITVKYGGMDVNGQTNINGEVSVQNGGVSATGLISGSHLSAGEDGNIILSSSDGTQANLACMDGKLCLTVFAGEGDVENPTVLIDNAALATVADVATAVANAGHLKREKVSALPGVATAKENVIYMVPNSTTGNNKFDEYMLIDGAFEKTGSSDIDLSGYPTTTQMNTAISNAHTAITEAEINALT